MKRIAKKILPVAVYQRLRPIASYMMRLVEYMMRLVKSWVPDYWYTVFRYKRTYGRWPNLSFPKTFNEKVNYKKLFCRDPLLTKLADKYEVRQYVRERIGDGYLTKLYRVADNAEEIDFSWLPDSFVIKATHGCGWNIIVRDKSKVDVLAVKRQIAQWLGVNYYNVGREWCYKNIQPRVIVEEFLGDESGKVPYDYGFFCFNGVSRMIQVDADCFEHHARIFYDTDWKRINVKRMYYNFDFPLPAPTNLGRMIVVAEALSAGLDFVRVDLYSTGDRIYFGEMTQYPANGFGRFNPDEFDALLGAYWVGVGGSRS
jgi:hypothetical protein